jgi:hypothetical protein
MTYGATMDPQLHTTEPHSIALDALRAAVTGVDSVLVAGAPGTGKSQLGELLARTRGTGLVSSDEVCCRGGKWLPWDDQPDAVIDAIFERSRGSWTAEGVAAARAVFKGFIAPAVLIWCDSKWVDRPGALASSMTGRYRRWATHQLARGREYRRIAPELLAFGLQLWAREDAPKETGRKRPARKPRKPPPPVSAERQREIDALEMAARAWELETFRERMGRTGEVTR